MPYQSEKQRKWANSKSGRKALGREKVEEFNRESKGLNLSEYRRKYKREK